MNRSKAERISTEPLSNSIHRFLKRGIDTYPRLCTVPYSGVFSRLVATAIQVFFHKQKVFVDVESSSFTSILFHKRQLLH